MKRLYLLIFLAYCCHCAPNETDPTQDEDWEDLFDQSVDPISQDDCIDEFETADLEAALNQRLFGGYMTPMSAINLMNNAVSILQSRSSISNRRVEDFQRAIALIRFLTGDQEPQAGPSSTPIVERDPDYCPPVETARGMHRATPRTMRIILDMVDKGIKERSAVLAIRAAKIS